MDLREAARRACCSVVQVVHLILDRQMAWVGRHTPNKGFASMLVKLDEVKDRVASQALPGLPARPSPGRFSNHPAVRDQSH